MKDLSSRQGWYPIGLLMIVYACNLMDRMALAVLAPLIKADLALSDAQLGLLTGFAFSVCYAVAGIPIARWADRGIRKHIVMCSLLVWSGMTALCGAAQNLMHLFFARAGVGIGEAGSSPATQSIICDSVPFERRAGVFAVYNFGGLFGAMIGFFVASRLGEYVGWRWTFLILGIPGVLLALIVKFTLREPLRGALDAHQTNSERLSLGATLAQLWRCKTYRWLTLVYVTTGFAQYGLNQWWPSFYVRSFGLSMSSAGTYLGVAFGLGPAIGTLLGVVLAKMAVRREVRWPIVVGAGTTALALPAAMAALFVPSVMVSIVLVTLAMVFWSISNGPIIAAVTSVVSSSMRATAASITIFCTSVLGFGLGPFAVGLLSDGLTPALGDQALRYALLLPVFLIPVMALAAYAASRKLPHDLQAAGTRLQAVT